MKPTVLGEVIEITHGYAFKSQHFSDTPEDPVIVTPGNFAVGGGFQAGSSRRYTGEVPPGFELAPGDLVITMTDLSRNADTLGLPAVIPEDGCLYLHNQRIGRVRVLDPDLIHLRFLAYYLRTAAYRSHVIGTATGTTVRHTSPGRIRQFVATIPGLKEQAAIAEVLNALDDKIAANARIPGTAEELAIMLAARPAQRVELRELAALQRAARMPHGAHGEPILHYSLPAYDDTRLPTGEAATDIKSSKFHLTSECVLVSKLNPRIPRVWLADGLTGLDAWASTEFMPLEPMSVSPRVLWSVLAHSSFTGALAAKVAGTSGSHQRVRPDDMLTTEVLDPRELDAQTLSQIDGLIEMATRSRIQSRTLAQLRDTLLPQLMSGKLRVGEAERLVEEAL